ncbi:MAG: hypothetical protein KF678_10295 [Phycisphaeraceae bacterium]|nr:hypothetical protein [Phycisphaeraceae bacterium]
MNMRPIWRAQRLSVAAGLAVAAASATAQCRNPIWTSDFSAPGSGVGLFTKAITVFDPDGPGPMPEELYVAGSFQSAGGVAGTRGIAKWNGQAWSSVGGGLTSASSIDGMCVFDLDGNGPASPVLAVVGTFTQIGGVPANRMAFWDGVQWTAPASGYTTELITTVKIIEFDADGAGPLRPVLVALGEPTIWPGPELMAWDGQSWSPLPDPGAVASVCMAQFDEDGDGPAPPKLFLGIKSSPGILRLDGSSWEVVGGGLNIRSGVYKADAMAVIDEDGPGPERPRLWVGGFFNEAGTTPALGLARWDGSSWQPGPGNPNFYGSVMHSIASIDYSNGLGAPDIFVMRSTTIDRWNRATGTWSVAGQVQLWDPSIRRTIQEYRSPTEAVPSMYVMGGWVDFNGVPAQNIARYKCDPCYPNCDGSTGGPVLSASDFQCFFLAVANNLPWANCDSSTGTPALTANDFLCFMNKFAAGCS